MSENGTFIPSLAALVEIPDDGILSKPIATDTYIRATLFGMSPGQEMSEHTTTMEALLQILEGDAQISLGEDSHHARAGTWICMPPNLRHSITALTPLKMLLIVLREAKGG